MKSALPFFCVAIFLIVFPEELALNAMSKSASSQLHNGFQREVCLNDTEQLVQQILHPNPID